jgi:hypothetical protein
MLMCVWMLADILLYEFFFKKEFSLPCCAELNNMKANYLDVFLIWLAIIHTSIFIELS